MQLLQPGNDIRLQSAEADKPAHDAVQAESRSLGPQYDAVLLDALQALLRAWIPITASTLLGLCVAFVAAAFMKATYSADAVIHLNLAQGEAGAGPPPATLDAGALVEGEARMLRSHEFARRVVVRLRLDENPDYTRASRLNRLLGMFNSEAGASDKEAGADLAAVRLLEKIGIGNDTKSYLIHVSGTSDSPEEAARFANAFVDEYVYDRSIAHLRKIEAGFQKSLTELKATFGAKHPKVVQVSANLEQARAAIAVEEDLANQDGSKSVPPPGRSVTYAETRWIPAGPNKKAIIVLGALAGLISACLLVLLLERRDTGFRSERTVLDETGVRSVGMIPKSSDRYSKDHRTETREAYRGLCLTTRLASRRDPPKVIMVTSSIPGEGKSDFVSGLAEALVDNKRRVLVIDSSPGNMVRQMYSLERLLSDENVMQKFFASSARSRFTRIERTSQITDVDGPFSSLTFAVGAFESFIEQAKEHYDAVIIESPPALLLSEPVFLSEMADLTLHVAKWNSTPQAVVKDATEHLHRNMVGIDGIVLTEVDLAKHRKYALRDKIYYLDKYRDTYTSNA